MPDRLLKIYHRLPAPARSLAVSLRGFYLRSWRYGAESESLVVEALERERWSSERWLAWKRERLAFVLHRAATRVPYYREYWSGRRRQGDHQSWEELKHWPVLSKESVRENPLAFVADDCDTRQMFSEQTSGTSGKPLKLWWSRDTVREWYALFESRARRWHGVTRNEPWAILGGQPIAPASAKSPPFWVWNSPMKQLYLSANHLSAETTPAYLDALERHGVTHLVTYSSAAASIAREAFRLGSPAKGIKVVITNAEPLLPRQRDEISRGFGCHARETYGMAEIVAAASECAEGCLHFWPETGWIEIFSNDEDATAPADETGRLIATSLLNADMPLIRYEVGDRIKAAWPAWPLSETGCRCGRSLPMIGSIEGRTNDVLITRNGRQVYWLNPIFYDLPVCEAQIIQETLEMVRVRFIPAPGFAVSDGQTIIDRLRSRVGDVDVRIEPVTEIPRGPHGKFQAVICKVSADVHGQ